MPVGQGTGNLPPLPRAPLTCWQRAACPSSPAGVEPAREEPERLDVASSLQGSWAPPLHSTSKRRAPQPRHNHRPVPPQTPPQCQPDFCTLKMLKMPVDFLNTSDLTKSSS